MATKKQKRERGEARAAIHRAESIASGLRAQKRDREKRERQSREAAEKKQRADRKESTKKAMAALEADYKAAQANSTAPVFSDQS